MGKEALPFCPRSRGRGDGKKILARAFLGREGGGINESCWGSPPSLSPLCPHLCDGKPKRNDANAIVYRLKGIKKRTQSRSARREERFLAKEAESIIHEGDSAE